MSAEKDMKRGERQIFVVDVIAHQKNTWQGQIHWIQGNKRISFRNVMEMLHLMDSAISAGDSRARQETDRQRQNERKRKAELELQYELKSLSLQ